MRSKSFLINLLIQFSLTQLLIIFYSLTQLTSSTSVTPNQRNPYLYYFGSHYFKMFAYTQLGPPYIFSGGSQYLIRKPLGRIYTNIAESNIVLSQYWRETIHYNGFKVNSYYVSNPIAQVYMNITIVQNCRYFMLGFTVIFISEQLNKYLKIQEYFIGGIGSSISVNFSNVLTHNYRIGCLVKSFNTYTNESYSYQLFGFYIYTKQTSDNVQIGLSVWYPPQYQNPDLYIDVTIVIYSHYYTLSSETAQFSNLQISYRWNGYASNYLYQDDNFDKNFMEQYILDFKRLVHQMAFVNSNTIYFYSNLSNGQSNVFLQFLLFDKKCPENYSFKMKNLQLCSNCDKFHIYHNENATWDQFTQTFNNSICLQINTTLSGYEFNPIDGSIIRVCAYCTKCSDNYNLQYGMCKSKFKMEIFILTIVINIFEGLFIGVILIGYVYHVYKSYKNRQPSTTKNSIQKVQSETIFRQSQGIDKTSQYVNDTSNGSKNRNIFTLEQVNQISDQDFSYVGLQFDI